MKTAKRPLSEPPATPEEARLRTILNSMVEAVFVIDDSGRVTLTNRALDRLLERDARGSRVKKVIRSKDLKLALRRAKRDNITTSVELEGEIGDRVHSFQAQVSPLPKQGGVVAVFHDVTPLKAADRVRRDFVANASHELRTPLTAIRGYAETLRNGAVNDPEACPRFLDGILRHTMRLQQLAEDLVILSQAESPDQGYEAVPTDIGEVCRETAATLESFASKKNIRVHVELPEQPVVISVSMRALEHVLINLVDNAIKYSPSDRDIWIRVTPDNDEVRLEVQDSGIGIPEPFQKRVFERFYRVDKGRSRDEGGSGLGLSIVRHLVERMGGTIELKSEVDKGTTFTMRLPIETANDNLPL